MRVSVYGKGITHTNHKNRPKFATLIGNSIRAADLREFLLSVDARIFGRYTTMGTIAYGLDMYIKTLDLQFFFVDSKKTKQLLEISLAKYAHFNAYKHTFLCLVELVCQSSRMNLSSHCLVVGLSHGVIVILTGIFCHGLLSGVNRKKCSKNPLQFHCLQNNETFHFKKKSNRF